MGRFKIFSGISLYIQALSFMAIMLLASSSKRKRVTAFTVLAAACGGVGTYLILNGAKDLTRSLDFSDDAFIEDDDMCDIDCNIFLDHDNGDN